MMTTRLDETFGSHPDLKKLYNTYLVLIVVLFFLSWITPVAVYGFLTLEPFYAVILATSLLLPTIVGAAFTAYWIQRYQASISFLLARSEIVVQEGVWWKKKSYVPYNRITSVEISQGPIARHFKLGTVSIQTAGYSGVKSSGSRAAEAEIFGVKNFEEVKDLIMSYVRKTRPVAVEAEVEDLNAQMLEELKKIRDTLERSAR